LWCAVCVISGYILSYWNRPFFPELCGDGQLDDPQKYDTMVRTGGSWSEMAQAFKVIAEEYGWKHIVLISDDRTSAVCYYAGKPLNDLLTNDDNYTFTWLRFDSDPTDEELDYQLEQIRTRTRGASFILYVSTLVNRHNNYDTIRYDTIEEFNMD